MRLAFADVKGISEQERRNLMAGQPYSGLQDAWNRAGLSRPSRERLVLVGAFDPLYGIGRHTTRGGLPRRDLLVRLDDLERSSTQAVRDARVGRFGRAGGARRNTSVHAPDRSSTALGVSVDSVATARGQAQGRRPGESGPDHGSQLMLDFEERPAATRCAGLPELAPAEKVRAELEVLGLDVSEHAMEC